MKKYRKKEMLKTLSLMEKVNGMVENLCKTQSKKALDVLIQCQEAALEIGNNLETIDGNGKHIVVLLEDYCENLYQMSESLHDQIQCRKLKKAIEKQLASIKETVCLELPDDKLEVAFFPYKASMWDSLESVWMAAKEDEACEAYVVPIPYFDKNPDGTLGQMHYEGSLYPKNVPITPWETYHVAERQPDIIYIHNPYDQYNYVTTVHPDFYAAQLKKYTSLLIYIPYFISTSHRVSPHFCVLPGTLYADKVIVEDDEIRKTYMEQFCKYEEENHCQGLFGKAEEKFLALGSPKFDKVFSISKESVTVPLTWKRFFHKEDGMRRKVVLYNTTVDGILKHENYVEKLRHVLRIFYENRNEVILLWRPHPLNLATIKAMRPEQFAEYNKIVETYQEAGYGIYDDTPDLHRAIALSDAYYGDWSSVVSLYEKTGKPIMIQNVKVVERD